MALAKQKFREIILQLLFSNNFAAPSDDKIIPFMMQLLKTTKKNVVSALEYSKKILSQVKKIDEHIQKVSVSYKIERISKVEITILRLALYEILFDENIPCKVAISEAIRLTKKFGAMQSSSFINAILDAIYKQNEIAKK